MGRSLLHRALTASAFVWAISSSASAQANAPIIGRWDLTVRGADKPYPSWLEVTLSGSRTLVGRFTAGGGSARPISRVEFHKGVVHFAIPPQWDAANGDMVFDGTVAGDVIDGTITTSAGAKEKFTAKRAPLLRRTSAPVWGKPDTLFNGKDLKKWDTFGGTSNWSVVSGVMENAKGGANIITRDTYTDFKLHVEFKFPKDGNSGVFLRGRYEAQIEDDGGKEPILVSLGAIYGLLLPNENPTKGPGAWHTYDITLIGRRVTIVLNGKTIIADQTIAGITGGALDSDEAAPGPIYLQGDHGPVSFRNIIITPAMSGAK